MSMARRNLTVLLLSTLVCVLTACANTAPKPEAVTPAPAAPPTMRPTPAVAPPAGPTATPAPAARGADLPADYRNALSAMAANKDAEAERLLVAVTEQHPDLAGAYINLGIARYRAGHWDDAITALNKAISLAPDNAVAYNYLGMTYRHLGKFKEAGEAYQHAVRADARYAYAYRNLGILYDLYLREPKQALDNYRQYQTLTDGQDKEVAQWIVELEHRMQQQEKAKP